MVNTRSELDTFIYPVVFCFRHSIELELKDMIKTGMVFSEDLKIKKIPDTHDIIHLWGIVKKLLIATFPDEGQGPLNHVGRCINEIDAVDKKSMAFRYPMDLNGNQHLDKMKYINTINLAKTMKAINNFMGAASSMLDMAKDHHLEMMNEFRDY
ncbi:hypothetical protein OAT67_04615 [Bacteriovoracaceae bacterium]|nr:hypothetical protein [Bacteriovoracaceae bacterium]